MLIGSLMIRFFLTYLVLASVISAEAQVKDNLRKYLIDSLKSPEAVQYISFGPMKDGRTVEAEILYHSERGERGIPNIREGARDVYKIDFPRRRIVKAPIVMDAMMACAQYKSLCFKMEDYLDAVDWIENIADVPFIDDLFPEYTAKLEGFRNSKLWAASVLGGIESMTLVINLHEIAHAALNHDLSNNQLSNAAILRQEAEADGFLLAFLAEADMSAIGGIVALVNSTFREEAYGEFSFKHPRPSCRSKALTENSLQWMRRNKERLEKQGFGEDIDEASRNLSKSLPILNEIANLIAASSSDCSDYARDVAIGAEKSLALIDKNMTIKSSP